ncbi:MAG: 50S ribosomal protein L18Ae [Candidatus Methanomethylicia archaeon]|nr:50S ribosomal protein L18Ae [Candidatus Methanomethylicia archaeon]
MSKNYSVKGKMRLKFEWKKFEKKVAAKSPEAARELALSKLGGNHGIKRFDIVVSSVDEIAVNPQ